MVTDRADHTRLQIPSSVKGVMYLPGSRLRRDGVDREIPTREIVHEVIPERHLRVPATLSVEVAPVRRDLYVVSTDLGSDSPEALTHHPQVVRHWPQKLLDLLWARTTGRIYIIARAPRKRIPHETTNQVQFAPRLSKPLPEAGQRLGNANAFYFRQHHFLDSITQSTCFYARCSGSRDLSQISYPRIAASREG